MIASLHWSAWLLLLCSVLIGLVLELAFFITQRRRYRNDD